MFTKEVLQKTLDKVLALSKPPQVINEGLPTEALVYSKELYAARTGGNFPFGCSHIMINHKEARELSLSLTSFEEDIWAVCKPDKELANAVYDFAMKKLGEMNE